MQTKQLLEVALKVAGIVMIWPSIISLPIQIYGLYDLLVDDFDFEKNWILYVGLLLYLSGIYLLIIRTDVLVNYLYKRSDETENNPATVQFHRQNIIFFTIVLSSLYALVNKLPMFIIYALQSGVAKTYGGSLIEDSSDKTLLIKGIEITMFVLALVYAKTITNWVEWYRRKQLKGN